MNIFLRGVKLCKQFRIVFAAVLISFCATDSRAQYASLQAEASQLLKVMLEKHVSPPLIDNQFSDRVFSLVFHELDPDGLYLTMEEMKALETYRDKIDDDLKGKSWAFFPALITHYREALTRSHAAIAKGTEVPFDVFAKMTPPDTMRARTHHDHHSLWRLTLHFKVMDELADRRPLSTFSEKEFLAKNEPLARKKVKLRVERSINRMLLHSTGFENFVATTLLQCISMAFDPHSKYMSKTQMENFISRLSTEGYYFGIGVDQKENGDIVIENIKPGGPAWKSGLVHNGDVIEKLRWKGSDWIDITGMDESEVDDILSQSNHNSLELSLQNLTHGQTVVELKKEKIDSDANIVRSFILAGEKRVGYIYLPDFYSEWGENEGSKCASDVAREIVRLKAQHVDGLILDIRYNGGGSLSEAVAMAGSFIDAGPMGILGNRGTEPVTEKDYNRGTVWDGPLIVMVNKLSASASEFLAAALQDYRRALIVGSITYGKATAQEMFSMRPGNSKIDFTNISQIGQHGFSTITTSKIYRITGKSLQNTGVSPDIKIPDLFDQIDYHESLTRFPLKRDSILKKTYYTPFAPLPVECLRERSAARIKINSAFQSLTTYINMHSLAIDQTFDWSDALKRSYDMYGATQQLLSTMAAVKTPFSVEITGEKGSGESWDDYRKAINTAWIKNISQDISLGESFHIMCDYIDLTNSK